jgi:hypothetical protein
MLLTVLTGLKTAPAMPIASADETRIKLAVLMGEGLK